VESTARNATINSLFLSWAFFVKYFTLVNVAKIEKKCWQVHTQNFKVIKECEYNNDYLVMILIHLLNFAENEYWSESFLGNC